MNTVQVKVGKKVYFTFGEKGIVTCTTREDAREFARQYRGIVVEAPITSNQAKVITKVLKSTAQVAL